MGIIGSVSKRNGVWCCYEILKVIDSGSFGCVMMCLDRADPNERIVAAKISKNKKFDIDNA